jgi:hypothetical protein
MYKIVIVVLLLLSFNSLYAFSQSDSDLAKQTQNPLADLISLPFQNNFDFNIGPNDRTQYTLNIQPVAPFKLTEKWSLITRTIFPLLYKPDILENSGGVFGIGDTTFTSFISPRDSGKLIWGVGPIFLLPTATDDKLGTGKWGAGPSVVALITPDPWVIGFLVSNVWSFAGDSDRNKVNLFTLQYFINYNLPNGWYLTSAPINKANWEAEDGNKWTIPIGGGGGKVVRIGKLPVNIQTQVFYNVEKPEIELPGLLPDVSAADWQFRFQMQFLFPK